MTQPQTDGYDPARQAEAGARLNGSIREARSERWAAVHARAGIRFAGESTESIMSLTRQYAREWGTSPIAWVADAPAGSTAPIRGELVVLWNGDEPTRSNQFVRRVEHDDGEGPRDGTVVLLLGNPVPRSEWPEALREATSPTEIHAEFGFTGDVGHVTVKDGRGKEIFAYRDASEAAEIRWGYLAGAIAKAADLGREDASAGRERRFAIGKGSGGAFKKQAYWQLVSDAGTVVDLQVRAPLSFVPPKFVQAVLAATKAAYAEGLKEALDAKAARDAEVGPVPLGM